MIPSLKSYSVVAAVVGTPPGAPTGVQAVASNQTPGGVSLSWAYAAGDVLPVTGYRVQVQITNGQGVGAYTTILTATNAATSVFITGLTDTDSVTFRIAAKNAAGYGAYSDPSSSVVVGGPVTTPAVIRFSGLRLGYMHPPLRVARLHGMRINYMIPLLTVNRVSAMRIQYIARTP